MPSLFKHSGKKTTTPPSPAPSATPARKHRIRNTEEAQPSASPGAASAEETPSLEVKPNRHPTLETPPEEVPAPSNDKTLAPTVETKTPVEMEAEETSHFQAAKAKALTDPHVQDLQAKADSATGDDVKPAARRYYKALFNKMREIDPTVKDRIDRTEAATMRRVEQEGPQ